MACNVCDGTGLAKCEECRGSGIKTCDCCHHDSDCKQCDGTGEEKCKECSGCGLIENDGAHRLPKDEYPPSTAAYITSMRELRKFCDDKIDPPRRPLYRSN